MNCLSHGKALSCDLVSDTFLDATHVQRASQVLNDLWSCPLEEVPFIDKHFQGRLIPLNKKHPETPARHEFRPILVLSSVFKTMESRFLPKAQAFLNERSNRGQVGFVQGCGVQVNIARALDRIRLRTNRKTRVYGLFIDFKSAYNTILLDKLFDLLKEIYTPDEVDFIKEMYSRIKIRMGDYSFKPNIGVPQGSILAPAFFNIYINGLLNLIQNEDVSIEDILAYADDLLILCTSKAQLRKVVKLN